MSVSIKKKLLVSFISGLTFAILNNLFKYFLFNDAFSLARFAFDFAFFGFIFGFGYTFQLERSSKKLIKEINIPLKDDEIMLHEGAANLLKNYMGIGGKLVVTNKRLVFKSPKLNVKNGEISIALNKVVAIQPIKTANYIQEKIRLKTSEHEKIDFVIFERDKWINQIEKVIS